MCKLLTACLALVALCIVLGQSPAESGQDGENSAKFVRLDLKRFRPVLDGNADNKTTKTYKVVHVFQEDGQLAPTVMHCKGKPKGYIVTPDVYENYVLRFGWEMFGQPKKDFSVGCLIHVQANDRRIWPKSVEIDGTLESCGKLRFHEVEGEGTHDAGAANKAVKVKGRNTTEITCLGDGSVSVVVNGVKVSTGKSTFTKGRIGFCCEGDGEIRYSNIEIKRLDH